MKIRENYVVRSLDGGATTDRIRTHARGLKVIMISRHLATILSGSSSSPPTDDP